MDGTFDEQIFMDKLAKLNNSQQSIETLSHWCIFHRKYAKQVVESWDIKFRCSTQEQRVSFLFLANDILQNSRRKGVEFMNEFWNFLPGALRSVYENGDEFGRNVALRLVNIWEERKVFGSQGKTLKDLLGRTADNSDRNRKNSGYKLNQSCGDILEKLKSSCEHLRDGTVDQGILIEKYQRAVSCIEKMENEVGGDLGNLSGSGVAEELKVQCDILRDCIEDLISVESSRRTLVSHLREAVREQETKIEQIHIECQAAEAAYMRNALILQQVRGHMSKESLQAFSENPPAGLVSEGYAATVEGQRKTTAAEVVSKLTASSSSAEVLSYVFSSLAAEGVSQPANADFSSGFKRTKLENGTSQYITSQTQPSPPAFPHPDALQQPPPPTQAFSSPISQMGPILQAPLILPSASMPQFMQAAEPMVGVTYNYGSVQLPQRPSLVQGYPMTIGMPQPPYLTPPSTYYDFQAAAERVGLFNHPPSSASSPSSASGQ